MSSSVWPGAQREGLGRVPTRRPGRAPADGGVGVRCERKTGRTRHLDSVPLERRGHYAGNNEEWVLCGETATFRITNGLDTRGSCDRCLAHNIGEIDSVVLVTAI